MSKLDAGMDMFTLTRVDTDDKVRKINFAQNLAIDMLLQSTVSSGLIDEVREMIKEIPADSVNPRHCFNGLCRQLKKLLMLPLLKWIARILQML